VYRIFLLIVGCLLSGKAEASFMIKDTLCNGGAIHRSTLDSLIDVGNSSVIVTHCPQTSIAPNIAWDFINFKLDPRDTVLFFDGPDLNSPKLGGAIELFGFRENFTVKSSLQNLSGCLTMLYKPDSSSALDPWSFSPSCFFPCQPFNFHEINRIKEDSICPGTELRFEVEGKFGNIQKYPQGDSLVEYIWYINKAEVGRGKSLQYRFDEPGGFAINVQGKDSMNCEALIDQQIAIKVSGPPQFVVGSEVSFEFCQYDTIAFSAHKSSGVILDSAINLIAPQYQFDLTFRNGDTLEIPDADGSKFISELNLNEFKSTDTLRRVDDLESICVNMEHTYLYDLYIQLECPSGQSIYLQRGKSSNTDTAYFLGKPIDNDENVPTAGEGLDYCWSLSGDKTWNDFLIDKPKGFTLPADTYLPVESFSGLIGCPVNGTWKLIVTDTFKFDNGFIFEWSLQFAESFYPGRTPFSPEIVRFEWTSPSGTNSNDSTALWKNMYPNPGSSFFNLSITDDFGCTYDSTFLFDVLPEFHPDCRNCRDLLREDQEIAYCDQNPIPLNFEGRPSKIDFVTFENYNSDSILISDIKSDSLERICIRGKFNLTNGINIYAYNGTDTIILLDTTGSEAAYDAAFCIDLIGYNSPLGLWKIAMDDPTKGHISFWSLSLTNTFEVEYLWENNPTGLNCSDCPNPIFSPNAVGDDTTQYKLNAKDNFGCAVSSLFTGIAIPIYDSLKVDTLMPGRGQVLFIWNAPAPGLIYETNWGIGWKNTLDTFHLFENLSPGTTLNFRVRVASTTPDCPHFITEVNIFYNPCELKTEVKDIRHPQCFNSQDGSFTVQTTGGLPPYNYNLLPDSSFNQLMGGKYLIKVRDISGCTDSVEVDLIAPDPIDIEFTEVQSVSCFDELNGIIQLKASGGNGTFSYLWNGQLLANDTIKNLGRGTYLATITDRLNCSLDTTYTINAPDAIDVFVTYELPSCFGYADGKIFVVTSGGTGPYEFHWDNGQQKADLENLSSGTYCLTITDVNGCQKDTCLELLDPVKLTIDSIIALPPKCFGEETGSAQVYTSGGKAPIGFLWNDPFMQNMAFATNLKSGNYEVVVVDLNMCFESAIVTLEEPEELKVGIDVKNVSCFGFRDGSIEVSVVGGSAPYTYLWTTGAVSEKIDALAFGVYSITITDSVGCRKLFDVPIASPTDSIRGVFNQIKEGCFGASDNVAEVSASGGYGGYTFEWSNGKTGALQQDLDTLEYRITVKDSSGCQIDLVGKPKDFPEIKPNMIVKPPSCLGLTNGEIGINFIEFGVDFDSLTFEWNNGKTGPAITNLPGGTTYTVTVTHNNGCQSVVSRDMRMPTDITFELQSDPVSCFGGSDGKARIENLFSEDPNFTFRWDFASGNQTTRTAVNLTSGVYGVTIKNGAGCEKTGQINVATPPPLRIQSIVKNNDCHGDSIGRIELNLTGGTGNYFYSWSNGFLGRVNDKLTSGPYAVLVKDGNDCEVRDSFEISQPDFLDLDALSDDVSCFGNRDGRLEALPFGGTPPYRFSLDGNSFSNSPIFGGLLSGAYQVWVRDSKGCVSQAETKIGSPPRFLVNLGTTNYKIKLGDEIELNVSHINGQPPFKYNWISSVPEVLNCLDCPTVLVNTPKLTFIEVVVTDSKGCITSDKTTIVVDKNRIIEVPTGFSPNGDGNNDLLLVHGTEGTRILVFRIFDRWGEMLFETRDFDINDPLVGWDGRYREKDLGPGVYLWQLEAEFIDGIIENYKGTTTLIR
jgi:gliding motility-associated-like protein